MMTYQRYHVNASIAPSHIMMGDGSNIATVCLTKKKEQGFRRCAAFRNHGEHFCQRCFGVDSIQSLGRCQCFYFLEISATTCVVALYGKLFRRWVVDFPLPPGGSLLARNPNAKFRSGDSTRSFIAWFALQHGISTPHFYSCRTLIFLSISLLSIYSFVSKVHSRIRCS
jgi:hypothetical protein